MNPADYFDDLTQSLTVARMLLQNANKNHSAIEGLCLYVSIIDGFLRLSIIYSRTQKSPDHTSEFEKDMIRQDDGEKTYKEKEIYDIARRENIISTDLYERLNKMYLFRNKVVHRFSISNITYAEIGKACDEFEVIYKEIFDIVAVLEHGHKGIPKPTQEELDQFEKHTVKKIGQ